MVNRRDRILAAFRFEDVQPVPYTIWYDYETMEGLNQHYGSTQWQSHIQDYILRVTVNWEPRNYVDGIRFTDIFGVLWQEGNPVHVIEPALREPTLKGFDVPSYVPYVRNCKSADPNGRHSILPMLSYDDTLHRLKTQGNRVFTVVGYGFGIFESAWTIRGYEEFFSDLLLEPRFANELLDLLLERHLELLDVLLELPCDGIIFSDDYGDQRGVIIGPDLWRKMIKPRVAKLYERVHAAGKMTFQHTCGNVFDIVPDLIDMGLDVLQSIQPEAMPAYEIKKHYGRNLRLWGGLGTQKLLPFGTPDEILAEIRKLKGELGKGGGYVFTSSKPIMKDVPVENAVALIEEVIRETGY